MTHDWPNSSISRRALLASAAGLPFSYGLIRALSAATPDNISHLVMREKDPQNLESDFSALASFLTSNENFYVRNHFAVPQIDSKSWRLKVEGVVAKPVQVTYDELVKLVCSVVLRSGTHTEVHHGHDSHDVGGSGWLL